VIAMSQPDHFQLFDLPATFALDRDALDRAYLSVQASVHPDRHAAGSAAERRVAMQWATRANEAYQTLKSPLKRAAYMCEQAGVPIAAESNTAMPAAFLHRQMEWREALENVSARGDATALHALDREMAAERDRLIADLQAALDVAHDHARAAALVRQLMFVEKFAAEIGAAEHELEAGESG
jgi:molecular chaperone HscB